MFHKDSSRPRINSGLKRNSRPSRVRSWARDLARTCRRSSPTLSTLCATLPNRPARRRRTFHLMHQRYTNRLVSGFLRRNYVRFKLWVFNSVVSFWRRNCTQIWCILNGIDATAVFFFLNFRWKPIKWRNDWCTSWGPSMKRCAVPSWTWCSSKTQSSIWSR